MNYRRPVQARPVKRQINTSYAAQDGVNPSGWEQILGTVAKAALPAIMGIL